MPNHIHGIIIIGKNKYNVDGRKSDNCRRDAMHGVSTPGLPETPGLPVEILTNETSENKSGPQRKNLSSIIRGFKSVVTKHARQINPGFAWQSLFFDHVIRNNESFTKIRYYIWENPEKWLTDELNPDNKEL